MLAGVVIEFPSPFSRHDSARCMTQWDIPRRGQHDGGREDSGSSRPRHPMAALTLPVVVGEAETRQSGLLVGHQRKLLSEGEVGDERSHAIGDGEGIIEPGIGAEGGRL